MKECVNCKYGKGIGSDVWCGHDPKGKESYMFETDCSYYKNIHDSDNMDICQTDMEFGQKYQQIKRAMINDPKLHQKLLDPIKEWQTWVDLDIDNIKRLTYYLLQELVFTEPLTSVTKIIPLTDNNDMKIGVTLYVDKDCIYTTNTIKNDYSPLFISTDDIVSVLAELLDNEDNYIMREACHRIAWELHIVDDLKDKINKR